MKQQGRCAARAKCVIRKRLKLLKEAYTYSVSFWVGLDGAKSIGH